MFDFNQTTPISVIENETVETKMSSGMGTFLEPVVKSMYGSPILADIDISDYDDKEFETVVEWSELKKLRECFRHDDFFDIASFKEWAWTNHLETLIDPVKSEEIMRYDTQEAIQYIKTLNKSAIDSLIAFCLPRLDPEVLSSSWDMTILEVGIQLTTRISVLRLGKAKVSKFRTWVGRSTGEKTPKRRLDHMSDDPQSIGEAFLEHYIGPGCHKEVWTLGYRGGLWKLAVGDRSHQKIIYVEEFGEDDL